MRKIIITLFLAFILFSCDSGSVSKNNTQPQKTNPFIGMWEDRDEYVIETFVFTKDLKVTRTIQGLKPEIEDETNTGIYDLDEAKIYFYYEDSNGVGTWAQAGYLFNGNELTMAFSVDRTYTYSKIN